MDSVVLNTATSSLYSSTYAGSAETGTAAESQTFAEMFAAQLQGNTLAAVSGVNTESASSEAETVAGTDSPATTATGTGSSGTTALSNTADGSDSSDNLMMMLLMMMNAGTSGSGSGMNAAMTSLLSNMQGGGLSNVLASGGLSGLSSAIFNDPAFSAKGQAIVNQAMTRLGDPYSKSKRGTGNYVDCSYLAQWAYKQAGVDIPGTAAAQAKYCYENGYTISKDELQPGDLIFWTKHSSDSGRWQEIHHVAIYAGDGKIVEAKNPKNGVEVDDIWGESGSGGDWEIVMYARPR
jgi:cell wall-associated NlpC family hydrolase